MHDHPLLAPSVVRPAAVGLLAVLVTVWALLSAGPAVAHDQLVASDPADGAVLEQAPGALVLTYNADQLPVGAAVVVRDADGTDRADGAPTVSGATVTQQLQPGLPAGTFTVQWRSVSGDGHPIEGTFSFEVTAGAPVDDAGDPAEGGPGEATDGVSGTPGAEPGADAGGPADPSDPSLDALAAEDSGSASPVPWVVGLVAVLVAAGALAVRRARATGPEGTR